MMVSNSLPNIQLSNKEHQFQSTNQLTNNIITPGTTSTEVNYISNNNSSSFLNISVLQPLQNLLTSTHIFRCYQCNQDLLPWKWANTCTQCNIVTGCHKSFATFQKNQFISRGNKRIK